MAALEMSHAPREVESVDVATSEAPVESLLDPYRWQKRYYNKRYQEDADFKQSSKDRAVYWQRQKYRDDPVWREQRLQRSRERYHRKKADALDVTSENP
jgi:hypothetical protein